MRLRLSEGKAGKTPTIRITSGRFVEGVNPFSHVPPNDESYPLSMTSSFVICQPWDDVKLVVQPPVVLPSFMVGEARWVAWTKF